MRSLRAIIRRRRLRLAKLASWLDRPIDLAAVLAGIVRDLTFQPRLQPIPIRIRRRR